MILLAKGVYPVHLNARLSDFSRPPETPPVFISGPVGTGKTHLAVAYLVREIQKWGENSRVFIRSVDLFNKLRDSFRKNFEIPASAIIESFSRYRFLVIDDLGTERDTPLVQEALYDIIDHRAGHRLPTVITSNFTLDRVAEHYGEFGERLASRIVGMGETMTLLGKDRRRQK
jgi:DNA replication protein DnaC